MKKKLMVALLIASTMLTACQTNVSSEVSKLNESIEVNWEEGIQFEENKTDDEFVEEVSNEQSDMLKAEEIKQKYSSTEREQIAPLYNVAENQIFDFTFMTSLDALNVSKDELVTIHMDAACKPESMIYTNTHTEENDQGFTLSLSPIAAVLENMTNDEADFEDGYVVWGNAPMYYIAIWYDMTSEQEEKLEKPIVIPFTVKHEVQAPEVRGIVDKNGCFRLEWKPVEGAEEYRIYNLTDSTHGLQETGEANEAVNGAANGYNNCILTYQTSTTDTMFNDFVDNGTASVSWIGEPGEEGSYCMTQNLLVQGEYYVSAVVDGKESGFASGVETSHLRLPYEITDDYEMGNFEYVDDMPLSVDVINIDGSVTERNICYVLDEEKSEEFGFAFYVYQVEGTMFTGTVSVFEEPEGGFPKQVGSISSTGKVDPENDINMQPDADVEPEVESEDGTIDTTEVIETQRENDEKYEEEQDGKEVAVVNEKYMLFADSPEEEWLALNMINAETEISVKAFPGLQYAEALQDAFYKVYYQNPYVLGVTRFGYDYKSMTFYVEYAYTKEEIAQMQEEIYEESCAILDEIITDGMSDEEKRNAIYLYLEETCDYDMGALEAAEGSEFKKKDLEEFEYAFNTYGIIVKKLGVCQSYAYAFKLLCSMSGVECNVMTGYLDGSLPHAWNVVKIEGDWYQTDSTNNGKISGIPYFLYNSDSETAQKTGFTEDELYDVDEALADYESTNQEYEYYYANNMYAEDLDEYAEILDELLNEDKDIICVRFDNEIPDQGEFEELVVETFYRKNMEDELAELRYLLCDNFIILTKN